MTSRRCAIDGLVLMAALVSLSGCLTPAVAPAPAAIAAERILVLPYVNMAAIYGEGVNVRCPVTGKIFPSGPVSPEAVHQMTDALTQDLARREDVVVVRPGQGVGAMNEILASASGNISERQIWIEAGRSLKVDAVLVGHIFRFRERQGTDYGVTAPASVAFDLHLLSVPDGDLLWTRSVDETQQALSENLFSLGRFVQRQGRWVKAEELAMGGMKQILSVLPLGKRLDKTPGKP